jgi:hypothetical protein
VWFLTFCAGVCSGMSVPQLAYSTPWRTLEGAAGGVSLASDMIFTNVLMADLYWLSPAKHSM